MTLEETKWLTLSEAQALLGVSRKTLYRYMDRKLLAYKKAANGWRYLKEEHISTFIEQQMITATVPSTITKQDNSEISKQLALLNTKIERQNQLLETMIELYKPESMHELSIKLNTLSSSKL